MTSPRPLSGTIAVGGAVALGAISAIQARINGALGVRLDDGIVAGLISFAVGFVAITAIVILTPSLRRALRGLLRSLRTGAIPVWMLLGGSMGALGVATQGLTAGIIGVALFTVGVVAGQAVHGLLLDRIGFGPGGAIAITPGRLIGGVLALIAVGIALVGDTLASTPIWMLVLPVLVGAGVAWQQGANGRLAQRAGSPLIATLVNFTVGVTLLVIASAVSVGLRGAPVAFPADPWLYIGGLLGVVGIFVSALLVKYTGVLVLGLASVLGQLVTAMLIDLVWPADSAPAVWQIVAMVAVAIASVLTALIRRRPGRPPAGDPLRTAAASE